MTRYVLHPGWVTSQNDGQRHYITAPMLWNLYGVPPAQCRVYNPQQRHQEGEVHLYPRYDGKYREALCQKSATASRT